PTYCTPAVPGRGVVPGSLIGATRRSTFETPAFRNANEPHVGVVLDALVTSPIDDPGTTPRPGTAGVQYVGVPEFQDAADRCTERLSGAIAGSVSVDDAIASCHQIASEYAG
ncbi:MAG: hypothetical protein AAGK32_06510, partial [Actinomycetota bacterium]